MPKVLLYNRQKQHRPDLRWLRRLVKAALPACVVAARTADAPILHLEEIEITVVDDADIARVHAEFMADPSPTDVITFHHGEILVSVDTALRQGREHGQSLDEELGLYMIHGLLHLAGWDDHDAVEAARMAGMQTAILAEARAKVA